jgi:hypothetical protein
MNAPSWLPAILAALMLIIAAYTLWRLAMARALDLPSDPAHDAVVLLLSVATGGMLVSWMHVLRPGIWALLLGAAGIGFAVRAIQLTRPSAPSTAAGPGSTRVALVATGGCAVAVYMLLAGVAPTTIQGSTAGYYTMAGMSDMYKDTTITFPALGVALCVVLAGYAVFALDRITAPTQSPARTFAPRSVALCEIAIMVTMAYAILAKLV